MHPHPGQQGNLNKEDILRDILPTVFLRLTNIPYIHNQYLARSLIAKPAHHANGYPGEKAKGTIAHGESSKEVGVLIFRCQNTFTICCHQLVFRDQLKIHPRLLSPSFLVHYLHHHIYHHYHHADARMHSPFAVTSSYSVTN